MLAERKVQSKTGTFEDWLKTVSPDYNWDLPYLIKIRECLDRIINGENLKLLIIAPPRHGKSLHTTIHFPAFFLEKLPTKKVIIAAYNQDFSSDFSTDIRRIVASRVGIGDKCTIKAWNTKQGGGLRSVSVQAGATGKGANLFIIDDPIRGNDDADSQLKRDKIWKTYLRDLRSRVLPDGTSFILIQTAWHYDDLAHRIMNSNDAENWIVLKFPALATEGDMLGRMPGQALWPEKFNEKFLLDLRKDDPSGFAALYQGSPEIDGGNIFKRDDWQRYTSLPASFDYKLQSIDTAWETKKQNDYSVCTTWGVKDSNIYLIDLWREKVEYPELKQQIENLFNYYKPNVQLIENEQSGRGAIQELRRNTNIPLMAIDPKQFGAKDVRARACAILVRNKKVFIPANVNNGFVLDFLDETAAFPKGKHDDIVDTVSMALNYIIYNSNDPISII
jgi:predicted phage terminase large subunit-like protein